MEVVDLTKEEVIDLTQDDLEEEEVGNRPIKRPRLDGVRILDLVPEPIFHTIISSNSITDVMHLRSVSQSIRRLVEGVVGIINQYRLPAREGASHITTLCVVGPIDIHRQLSVDINRYPKLSQLYISGVFPNHGYGSYVPLFLKSFDTSPGADVKVVSRGGTCDGFLGAILNHPRVSGFTTMVGALWRRIRELYRVDGWWFEHAGGVLNPYNLKMGGPFLLDMFRHDVRHAWMLCYGAVRYDDAARLYSSDGSVFYTRFSDLGEVCRTTHLVNQLRERDCSNLRGSHEELIRRIYNIDGLDYDAEMEQREAEIRQADVDSVMFWDDDFIDSE